MAKPKVVHIPGRNLNSRLKEELTRYLDAQGTDGGTSAGFRAWIIKRIGGETDLYIEALAGAADKTWRIPPKQADLDQFILNGMVWAEFLTRRVKGHYVTGDDIDADDEEEMFERVAIQYATVQDAIDNATIKLRKGAQAVASAERLSRQADEALRRAKGNPSKFLRDLAD
jgi:hypothetical protein